MNPIINDALWALTERYHAAWDDKYQSLPQTEIYEGIPSPCIVREQNGVVFWQAVKRESVADFSNVEYAIGIELHSDIKAFYSKIFCADLNVTFNNECLELIQIWSDEDLVRLQENILGHLFMQKKLKLPPTVFIGSTEDELMIISVCNQTGEILKEKVGTREREVLSSSVTEFLNQLTPDI